VDDDCPSVKAKPRNDTVEKIALPKPNFKVQRQSARRVVSCTLCAKPRILYSRVALTDDQVNLLDEALEESSYACGQLIFPTGHILEKVVFQPVKTKCITKISPQFYQLDHKIVGWRWVCSVCLPYGDAAVEAAGYPDLPRCVVCKEDGCDSRRARSNPTKMARIAGRVAAAAEDEESNDDAEDVAEVDAGAREKADAAEVESAEADDVAEVESVAEDAQAEDAEKDVAEVDANADAGAREEVEAEIESAEADDVAEAESVAEDAEADGAAETEDIAEANACAGARTEANVEGATDADVDEVEDDTLLGQITRSRGVRTKSQEGRRKSKRQRRPINKYNL